MLLQVIPRVYVYIIMIYRHRAILSVIIHWEYQVSSLRLDQTRKYQDIINEIRGPGIKSESQFTVHTIMKYFIWYRYWLYDH